MSHREATAPGNLHASQRDAHYESHENPSLTIQPQLFELGELGYCKSCTLKHAAFKSRVLALSPTQSQGKSKFQQSLSLSLKLLQVGDHASNPALQCLGHAWKHCAYGVRVHSNAEQGLMVVVVISAMRAALVANGVSRATRSASATETRLIISFVMKPTGS